MTFCFNAFNMIFFLTESDILSCSKFPSSSILIQHIRSFPREAHHVVIGGGAIPSPQPQWLQLWFLLVTLSWALIKSWLSVVHEDSNDEFHFESFWPRVLTKDTPESPCLVLSCL